MAQTITIKQSTSTDAPTTLTNAELAYSASSNKLCQSSSCVVIHVS